VWVSVRWLFLVLLFLGFWVVGVLFLDFCCGLLFLVDGLIIVIDLGVWCLWFVLVVCTGF